MTYQDAHYFCRSICSQLYSPSNFDSSWNGLALTAYNDGIDAIHIGIQVHGSESGAEFIMPTNGNQVSKDLIDDFTDIYFFGVLDSRLNGTSNLTIPLALDTMSSQRYNMWLTSDQDDQHYFACESGTTTNTCYEYGVTYEPNEKILEKIDDPEICDTLCQNTTMCNFWSHDILDDNCYLRSRNEKAVNKSSMVSGSRVCPNDTDKCEGENCFRID